MNQMIEMMSNMQRQIGTKILSNTKNNPLKDGKEHVNIITLRSDKTLKILNLIFKWASIFKNSSRNP